MADAREWDVLVAIEGFATPYTEHDEVIGVVVRVSGAPGPFQAVVRACTLVEAQGLLDKSAPATCVRTIATAPGGLFDWDDE